MNLPNKITLSRIILIPFFIAAFMLKDVSALFIGGSGNYWVYIATGIFALASLTDFLDGYLARKNNLVTDMGKFLDPIADKILIAAAFFIILGYTLVPVAAGVIIVTLVIGREFAISALRSIAAGKNVIIAADKIGKLKTVSQIAAVIVLLPAAQLDALIGIRIFYYTGFSLLIASALLAVISGVNYLYKNRKVFAENKAE